MKWFIGLVHAQHNGPPDSIEHPVYGKSLLNCDAPGQERWSTYREWLTEFLDVVNTFPNPSVTTAGPFNEEWGEARLASARLGARKMNEEMIRVGNGDTSDTIYLDIYWTDPTAQMIRAESERLYNDYNYMMGDAWRDMNSGAASFYHACWYPRVEDEGSYFHSVGYTPLPLQQGAAGSAGAGLLPLRASSRDMVLLIEDHAAGSAACLITRDELTPQINHP